MQLCPQIFGVSWVLPKRVIDLLASWRNWLGKHFSNVWNLVPHCVMWIIWRKRNNPIFVDSVLSRNKLLALFVTTLFDWSHAWGFTSTKSFRCFQIHFLLVHKLFCFPLLLVHISLFYFIFISLMEQFLFNTKFSYLSKKKCGLCSNQ